MTTTSLRYMWDNSWLVTVTSWRSMNARNNPKVHKNHHHLSFFFSPGVLLVLCLSTFNTALRDSTQGQQMSVWNINITDKGQCLTYWCKNMSECVLFEPDICEEWRSQEESVMCFTGDSVIIAERSAEYETDGLEQHRAGWNYLGTYLT